MELAFDSNERYALAFSGGCDSVCLLAEMLSAGVDVRPYYVKTRFQADFELEDARLAADLLGVSFETIEADVLSQEDVCANGPERCYHCKRFLFGAIRERMAQDGRTVLADGTNFSDDPMRRPGMKALSELGVVSPLREAGWTKEDVRARLRERGIFTAGKPNFSCYATKVPQGVRLDEGSLRVAERGDAAAIAAWEAERAKAIGCEAVDERGR